MIKSVYKSCNCGQCRLVSSSSKGFHKRLAHRLFRRLGRANIKNGKFEINPVSTGYKA